jgi:hypothetical protein
MWALPGHLARTPQRLRDALPSSCPDHWRLVGSRPLLAEYERKLHEIGPRLDPDLRPTDIETIRRQIEAVCVDMTDDFDPGKPRPSLYPHDVDRDEFAGFKRENRRTSAIVWWLVVFGSAAIGYGVALAWSFFGGVVVGAACLLVGIEIHLDLDRSRWLKRFPELAGKLDARWHHRSR